MAKAEALAIEKHVISIMKERSISPRFFHPPTPASGGHVFYIKIGCINY